MVCPRDDTDSASCTFHRLARIEVVVKNVCLVDGCRYKIVKVEISRCVLKLEVGIGWSSKCKIISYNPSGLVIHIDAGRMSILSQFEQHVVWRRVADWRKVGVTFENLRKSCVEVFRSFTRGKSCKAIVTVLDRDVWHSLSHLTYLTGFLPDGIEHRKPIRDPER